MRQFVDASVFLCVWVCDSVSVNGDSTAKGTWIKSQAYSSVFNDSGASRGYVYFLHPWNWASTLRHCRRALTVCCGSLFCNSKPVCVDHEWDDTGRYLSRRSCEAFGYYCRSVALCDDVFLVSGWSVRSVRGTCESLEESFVLLRRRAQSEMSAGWGGGAALGGGTETVLVFSGAEVCCCVGDVAVYSQWLEDDEQ